MRLIKTMRRNCKYIPFVVIIFYSIVFLMVFTTPYTSAGNTDGGIVDPYLPPSKNGSSNASDVFYRFEGQVFILSKGEGSDLYLYAQDNANIFREFSIYMLTNQKSYYQILIDNQVHSEGEFEFMKIVKASSPYSSADIEVKLVNETGVELPSFKFSNLILLDVGEAPGEPEEISPIIEPYIKMTQGEMNVFIATRLITDLSLTILGFLVGSSIAVLKTDYQGVEQVG